MAFPPGKGPPYTYDDPRMIYDELCYLYDGGFDEVCLIDNGLLSSKKGGASAGIVARRKPYQPPPAPPCMLDIEIKSCLKRVNDEDKELTGECDILKFKGQDSDMKVAVRLKKSSRPNRAVYGTVSSVCKDTSARIETKSQVISVDKPQRKVNSTIGEAIAGASIVVSASAAKANKPSIAVQVKTEKPAVKTYLKKNEITVKSSMDED